MVKTFIKDTKLLDGRRAIIKTRWRAQGNVDYDIFAENSAGKKLKK
jgi:hypothetical protein